jgi:hypothetical protein
LHEHPRALSYDDHSQIVAEQIARHLHHELTLAELVDWAESAIVDADFHADDAEVLRPVVGRLGVADVRAFGLTWADCESLRGQLGYNAGVEVVPT